MRFPKGNYRVPALRSGWALRGSSGDFNAISARIERDAFVVSIPGPPRAVQNRKTIVQQFSREFVDTLGRSHRNCNVGEAHALGAGCDDNGRERRRRHQLDARSIRKTKEAGCKTLGRVYVFVAGDGPEVGDVELLASLQIGSP